ncbi:MAG: hypothetical protein R3C05_00620 [Pirellulaceae bacterium]
MVICKTVRRRYAKPSTRPIGSGLQTIEFDFGNTYQTITLGGTELKLTDDVTIFGGPGNLITIDGNYLARVLHVAPDVKAAVVGVNITRGNANVGNFAADRIPSGTDGTPWAIRGWLDGGAVLNDRGNLILDRVDLRQQSPEWRRRCVDFFTFFVADYQRQLPLQQRCDELWRRNFDPGNGN